MNLQAPIFNKVNGPSLKMEPISKLPPINTWTPSYPSEPPRVQQKTTKNHATSSRLLRYSAAVCAVNHTVFGISSVHSNHANKHGGNKQHSHSKHSHTSPSLPSSPSSPSKIIDPHRGEPQVTANAIATAETQSESRTVSQGGTASQVKAGVGVAVGVEAGSGSGVSVERVEDRDRGGRAYMDEKGRVFEDATESRD